MLVPPAALIAGDVTEHGVVDKVASVKGRNAVVRVWFEDGTHKDFVGFKPLIVNQP